MSRLSYDNASKELALIEENNRKMQEDANPLIRGIMDEVQDAIDKENGLMDAQAQAHAKLRAWAEDLLGYKISITQIEELQDQIKKAKPNEIICYGNSALIKTSVGTVDRIEKYLFVLEKTIIDLSNQVAASGKPTCQDIKDPYTELSSFGLIKLAFKRLLKRSK